MCSEIEGEILKEKNIVFFIGTNKIKPTKKKIFRHSAF